MHRMSGKTVWTILLVGACLTACASHEPALIGNLLNGGIPGKTIAPGPDLIEARI